MKHFYFALAIVAFAVTLETNAEAATFVSVSYRQNGEEVARMIYTGSGNGQTYFWSLLGTAPERAYGVKIQPDTEGGKTAIIAGEIEVSIEIRNSIDMGTVRTDKLKLVRNSVDSKEWYIPADELKRVMGLIDKGATTKSSANAD